MSYFISSISAAGLIEMPPVSKVMPLPTSTTGLAPFFVAPSYFMTISLGGWAEPAATERSEPMPSFSICARSSTSTLSLCDLPSALACCAR
jgi:hypothetical protein